jgi:myo-inositol-1(or 4)-monophosphatase
MNNADLQLAEKAFNAVTEAGKILKGADTTTGRVIMQKDREIKLEVDLTLSHELISRLTRSTGIPSMSEEDAQTHGLLGERAIWIVDPLDGSMNFSRGLPLYCISVALWRMNQPVIGVIHDIERNRTFIAHSGLARVDGLKLSIGSAGNLDSAILATGFPLQSDISAKAVNWFLKFSEKFKKVRMLGTAALSLAWVAEGRLDAYFERDIMLWDIAAGAALVQCAGGVCIIRPGRHPLSMDVLSANPILADKMKRILQW